ncbi:MAG: hypothetical protein CO105_05295 [Comamonadaceae bacterium CG_4_9_14_3_um_filter_60_33]|nr:MAG: hypothetical protein CO105_05295 [Comamonadaceae bacterium CG_4_9_14_3_um_filter_60_33]
MSLIKQCNPDIDIGKIPHVLNAFLIHQRTHMLRGNDLRASRQQCIFAFGLGDGNGRLVLCMYASAGQS